MMRGWLVLPILLGAAACTGADEQHAPADSDRVIPPAEPAAADPEAALRIALEQLLRGSDEPQPGDSWFSAETAGALRSVSVDSAGHATVDFVDLRPLIPNASSSAGSAMLLEELDAAVFSVDGIESVEYRMDGSCALFWEWLQYGCHTVQRPTG